MEDFEKIKQPHLETVGGLYEYAKKVHETTNRYFADKSKEEMMKTVKTPWDEMPLMHHLMSAYEHRWHHRGQLYIYLRMTGVEEPVSVFDYGHEKAPA